MMDSTPPSPLRLPLDDPDGAADAAAAWDWGNLLDYIGHDATSPLPWEIEHDDVGTSGKVRKRDPRLVCENYLAGRVPCACPELDDAAAAAEPEAAAAAEEGTGRKKARRTVMCCQVDGCGADIRELKGYHRRHRVCLRCANASVVLIDGMDKRYCQQCGKFHILPDFDEGKRSCRRKLERHNNRRRRRRPGDDGQNMLEKETEFTEKDNTEYTVLDDEQTKDSLRETSNGSDSLCISNKSVDTDMLPEPDKHDLPFCSEPSVHTDHRNIIAPFAVSSEAQVEAIDYPISAAISSSTCGNKLTFSTACPTGRISFKLYDWNPAEFPRRLRHQIFQWLASMPVELEGYIRPGCTILTIFIVMPRSMWSKLSKDAARYLQHFINEPENMLFRRKIVHIYLNDTMFQVLQGGTSLVNIKMEVQLPKIHYIHPVIFEAGEAVEFIVCGSNIFQSNFRFLVSFAGKYLEHELENLRCDDDISQREHQIYRIRIPQTTPGLFGPAFIEVENDSGLSNFVPILLTDKNIYAELQKMHQSLNIDTHVTSLLRDTDAIPNFCEVSTSRQSSATEFFLDIGWLVKGPQLICHEAFFSIGNIQRLNYLLGFLIENGSKDILKMVLSYVATLTNSKGLDSLLDRNYADIRLFEKYIDDAKKILHQHKSSGESSEPDSRNMLSKGIPMKKTDIKECFRYAPPITEQEILEARVREHSESSVSSVLHVDEKRSLLVKSTTGRESFLPVKWSSENYDRNYYTTITSTRIAVFVMASVVLCFGLCLIVIHPHKAGQFAISVRRCIFGTHDQ